MDEPVNVSDHALVRFMERVMGLDLEPIREEMRAIIAGTSPADAPHGPVLVVEFDRVVVTVLGHGQRPKQQNRRFGTAYVPVPGTADGRPIVKRL